MKCEKLKNVDTYRQSLYITALDRFLGINGLLYPYQDEHGYRFDFYAPKGKRRIKVFTNINATEVEKYAKHPKCKQIKFIIDITTLMELPELFNAIPAYAMSDALLATASNLNALLFANNCLFAPIKDTEGRLWWESMLPREFDKGWDGGMDHGWDAGWKNGFDYGYQQCLAETQEGEEKEKQNALR